MDAGGLPTFPNANSAAHQLNQPQHHSVTQSQQQQAPPDTIAKANNGIERLKKRMGQYRQHHTECGPRFDQSFSGACEQQSHETIVLQKRFLENKAKKAAKKADKKQPDNTSLAGNLQSSVHVQQKFLKQTLDESENASDNYEPPHKLSRTGGENVKFSVEIVQQLEFTTSAANSQPQQISTNVTVKALTNASVKSDGSQQGNNGNNIVNVQQQNNINSHQNDGCGPNGNNNNGQQASPAQPHDLVECKQEPNPDFADLDECAAALEKDAAANGHFPGLSDLIGDDTIDDSDTFKDLISDLTDFNHSDLLDFDKKPLFDIKTEENCKPEQLSSLDNLCVKMSNNSHNAFGQQFSENQINNINNIKQQQQQQQQQHHQQQQQRNAFNAANANNNAPMCDLAPALPLNVGAHSALPKKEAAHHEFAQTLKQMAEQHQHKNAMGKHLYQQAPTLPLNGGAHHEFSRPLMQNNAQQMNQNRNNLVNAGAFGNNDFGQFNNSDFINNSNNQVPFNKNLSAGGNTPFDIAAKQEMMFSQQQQQQPHSDFDLKRMTQSQQQLPPQMQAKMNANAFNKQQFPPNHGSPGQNFMAGRNPAQSQNSSNNLPPRPPSGSSGPNQNNSNPNGNPSGAGNNNANQNNQQTTTLQMKQTQQLHINQQGPNSHGIHVSAGQHLHLSGDLKNNVSVAAQQGVYFSQQQQQQQQSQNGNNSNVNQQQQTPQSNNNSQNSSSESYTVSQSQTINFTQQTIRQRQTQPQQQQQQQQPPPNQQTQQSQAQQPNAQNPAQNQQQHPSNRGGVGPNPNNVMNPNLNIPMNMPSQNSVNLPQSMAPNAATAGGNPIQSMSTMGNPIGANMGSHVMLSSQSSMGNVGPPNANAMSQMQHQVIGNNNAGMVGQNAPNMMNGMFNAQSKPMPEYSPNMNAGNGPQMMRQDPKFLQQQQMLRAQAMQQMGNRPPPPEYKGNQMQNARGFPNSAAAAAAAANMRRMNLPPQMHKTGPMVRPQHGMYMPHGNPQRMAQYGQNMDAHTLHGQRIVQQQNDSNVGAHSLHGQRIVRPNMQVPPDGMPMNDWRHAMMSQQQSMNFNSNAGMRPQGEDANFFRRTLISGGNMNHMQHPPNADAAKTNHQGFGMPHSSLLHGSELINNGGELSNKFNNGAGNMQQMSQAQMQLMRQQQQQQHQSQMMSQTQTMMSQTQTMTVQQHQMIGNSEAGNQMNQEKLMQEHHQAGKVFTGPPMGNVNAQNVNTAKNPMNSQSVMQQMLVQQQQQQHSVSTFNQNQQQTMLVTSQQQQQIQLTTISANNNSQINPGNNTNNNNANNGNGAGNNNGSNNNSVSGGTVASNNAVTANNNDFSLEFLDNLPVGDTSNFSAQDLLNSLDNENFNFQDILQ